MNLFDFFSFSSPVHNKKLQADVPLCGRSMVEMLGVLAIIGVLSVGAISGYSKAMMKYKLNKQAEQINTVFNAVARYHGSFSESTEQGKDLTSVFVKMGEIPTEMINNNGLLYDVFGVRMSIRTAYQNIPQILVELNPELIKKSNQNLEICRNILTVAKENSSNLYYVESRSLPAITAVNQIYGDSYCSENQLCFKDVSLDDIYTVCTNFGDGEEANIIVSWKI